ncbi:hypothetical protein GCM10012280_34280 [Wenjunlia tyrosinilytica]|uniref:Uncharacterized protein n=1 Tax=Wenjunlia tyrosinilytica TaxID=1544741 RepID=A0A917ZQQ9_9ACTN|nr:hypothetical protein GCM10012280_34280 [Wenjunlia tyrosinilytica]
MLFGYTASRDRHPLVAVAMVVPIAVLFGLIFGGWQEVTSQASFIARVMGR